MDKQSNTNQDNLFEVLNKLLCDFSLNKNKKEVESKLTELLPRIRLSDSQSIKHIYYILRSL